MKQLAEALVKVQKVIKPAIKEAENEAFKRGNKVSKYADLTAVWDAVREPLTENGLCVIQTTDFDEHGMWLKTTLLHTSGESIEGRFQLRPTKPDMQGVGSAMTYARRYGLAAIIGVVADVDDDGNAASGIRGDAPIEHPPEANAERKAAANKWGKDALAKIEAFTPEQFAEWYALPLNKNGIATVREFNETLHGKLIAAVRAKQSQAHPLAAE